MADDAYPMWDPVEAEQDRLERIALGEVADDWHDVDAASDDEDGWR